jgi:hypothetical protein
MMNPASRELLGNDRGTSETGRGPDEATDEAQFRNVVGLLGRLNCTSDRRVDAMGHFETCGGHDAQYSFRPLEPTADLNGTRPRVAPQTLTI